MYILLSVYLLSIWIRVSHEVKQNFVDPLKDQNKIVPVYINTF